MATRVQHVEREVPRRVDHLIPRQHLGAHVGRRHDGRDHGDAHRERAQEQRHSVPARRHDPLDARLQAGASAQGPRDRGDDEEETHEPLRDERGDARSRDAPPQTMTNSVEDGVEQRA